MVQRSDQLVAVSIEVSIQAALRRLAGREVIWPQILGASKEHDFPLAVDPR